MHLLVVVVIIINDEVLDVMDIGTEQESMLVLLVQGRQLLCLGYN